MMERLARQIHQQPSLHEAAPSVGAFSLHESEEGGRPKFGLKFVYHDVIDSGVATSHAHLTHAAGVY